MSSVELPGEVYGEKSRGAVGGRILALLPSSISAAVAKSLSVGIFPFIRTCPPQSPRMAVPYWSTTATWLHASRTSSQPWLATWPPPIYIYIFFFYFQNSHLPLSPLTFPSLHLPIPLACRRLKSQKSWVLTRFLTLGLIFLYV